jgi:hypothetical protein
LQFAHGNGTFEGSQRLEGNRLKAPDQVGVCCECPAKILAVQNLHRKKENNERKLEANQ